MCNVLLSILLVVFEGYGKSVYFWALVSALGTFFLGAGVSMSHALSALMEPSLSEITNEVWAVLAMSFLVDGYVLWKTVSEIQAERPNDVSFWQYVQKIRDPATLAVLLEDGAACLGIVMAIAGIGASHATANPIFDGVAGVGISCLLGGIGLALVRVNHRFLIGQGVEREMLEGIEKIIRSRSSIDHVSSIQSQWTGPETFSFKAEIDFDGTYLSALLMPRYQAEFNKAGNDLEVELGVLLSWYAEDVIRAIEREVRHIEAMIRQKYPGAEYIELEPMSKHADRFAIDDSFEEKLLLIEKEELKRLVRVLYEKKDSKSPKSETSITAGPSNTTEKP
jgi:solute carrier family 30 (zinc transporter), member 9